MLKDKTKIRYYLKAILALLSVTSINAILGLITTIKIANELGPAHYGEIVYGFALGGVYCVILRFGTDKTLVRDYVYQPNDVSKIFIAVNWLKLVLLGIILLGIISWVQIFGVFTVSTATLCVAFSVVISGFQMQSMYDYKKKITRHAKFFLIHRVFYFIGVWFFLIAYPEFFSNAIPAIFVLLSVVLFLLLQAYGVSSLITIESYRLDISEIKSLIYRNWIFAVSSFLVVGYTSLSQVIIVSELDLAALGVYGVCFQFVSVAAIVVKQVSRVGKRELIKVLKKDSYDFRIASIIYISLILLSVCPIAYLSVFWSEWVLSTLFDTEYIKGANILRILGFLILANAILAGLEHVAIAKGIRAANLMANGANGIITCAISLAYISEFGTVSVALGLLVGSVSASCITFFYILYSRDPSV
ncbi:oligosaccharide flippase family protein [Neptunomonas japonica]|uniref:oligosaccharide flippase family protein n=1 Tax=Neptunomonas japonica TaxID=417574 RepID=UPI00041586B1|nr:oligosaccharide flippase family protein [Neptunomonas japonica]